VQIKLQFYLKATRYFGGCTGTHAPNFIHLGHTNTHRLSSRIRLNTGCSLRCCSRYAGAYYKHGSLTPHQFSITNLGFLICECMCIVTSRYISRHTCQTSSITTTTTKLFVPSIWGRLHEPKENYARSGTWISFLHSYLSSDMPSLIPLASISCRITSIYIFFSLPCTLLTFPNLIRSTRRTGAPVGLCHI